MTIHRTHEIPVVTNVSRRRVLKGLAAGGLVVAAQFPVVRDALGYATGKQDAERNRERPACLRVDRA